MDELTERIAGSTVILTDLQLPTAGTGGRPALSDVFLIYGCTVAEHDERLRQLLDQLVKHNATVRQDKCVIGVPEVIFNAHRVSAVGIRPLTSNVETIPAAIPVPINTKNLFYGSFVRHLTISSLFKTAEICSKRILSGTVSHHYSPTPH